MDNICKKYPVLFLCLILTFLALLTYWQVTGHGFVNFDDDDYVVENPQVQAGLTLEGVTWAFSTGHASNWHPLTWLSHMLDVQLYGLRAGGHHLTSLLFHLANTLLLFLVLQRLTSAALWPSALVAALFALHPLHVESVAWVSERKDVLSTLFWMLTLGAYVKYVERPGLPLYLLSLFLFALGLMAKPMLVTMPVVLLLLDYWPLQRVKLASTGSNTLVGDSQPPCGNPKATKRRDTRGPGPANPTTHARVGASLLPLILEKVPFFVVSAISSGITLYCQRGALSSLETLPLILRLENALTAYVFYIGKTIWPSNLSPYYPHPGSIPTWQVIGAATLLMAITVLVFRGARQFPYLVSGWLWYLVTLTPVIGIVQVGGQSMADRYTYVPLIGLLVMIAWGLPAVLQGWRHRQFALVVSSLLLITTMMISSWRQVGYWRDTMTLFGHALAVTENNAMAHGSLGKALIDQGRHDEAKEHLLKALQINPNDADLHNNLGLVLQNLGQLQEAIVSYGEALRLNPNHAKAHSNWGDILFNQGRIEEAEGHYSEAIRLSPGFINPYVNGGGLMASQGRYSEALALISQGLKIKPDSAALQYVWGSMLAAQGRLDEAEAHFRETVRLQPDHAEAFNDLGSTLVLQGRTDEGIDSFREALRLQPGNELTQKNLNDAMEMKARE